MRIPDFGSQPPHGRPDHREWNCSRRAFLAAGSSILATPPIAGASGGHAAASAVIEIRLLGGPSGQETLDPKPVAPMDCRGPARSIATTVPGVHFSEWFPELARRAHRLSIVRTLHHHEAPIHETGLQLLGTGRTFRETGPLPHWAAGASWLDHQSGVTRHAPFWVMLPHAVGDTGVDLPQGMDAAYLVGHSPMLVASGAGTLEEKFDWAMTEAVQWVRRGARVVTIPMVSTVFDQVSWDMHAASRRLPTGLDEYRNRLCPLFDRTMARLLDVLEAEGLLGTTLVAAAGEMGRTPHFNRHGGRDHWTGAWPAILAGGKIQPGRCVGRTDDQGAMPVDRPVAPSEWVATLVDQLGVDLTARIPGPDGKPMRLVDDTPIMELY